MILYVVPVLLAAVIIACIAIIYHDMNHFVVREYEIYSDKLKKDAVFCLLSDLHEKSFGENNSELIDAIRKINPDGILMAGDMITGHNDHHKTKIKPVIDIVSALSPTIPIYAANGNHEFKMSQLQGENGTAYDEYEREFVGAGATLLRNRGTYLEELNMEIHGLELDYIYYTKFKKTPMDPDYIKGFFGEPCESRFQLLIAHNPIYFEEYSEWGADLTVSGHVHGGIVRLPFLGGVISPAIVLFPKYDGGLFKNNNKYMILSRGLSTHSIPIRFNNPGELCVIRLKVGSK